MSGAVPIRKWRPVAGVPGGEPIQLPVVAGAVHLSRRTRREAARAAMVDASAGWVPAASGEEPDHCRQLDHQFLVIASQLCIKADAAAAELLTTMTLFVELAEITGPEPGAIGPDARHQAQDAARYGSLKARAYFAWSAWELARAQLMAELRCGDQLRRAARASYAAELAARHPHPDRLPLLDGVPDLCVRQAPAEPPVVTHLRRQYGSSATLEPQRSSSPPHPLINGGFC